MHGTEVRIATERIALRQLPQPQAQAQPQYPAAPVEVSTRRRAAILRRSLAVADGLAALLSLGLVGLISGSAPRAAVLALVLPVLLTGKLTGLYERDEVRLRRSTLEEVPQLFQLSGICALVIWLGDGSLYAGDLTRPEVVALWGILFATLWAGRSIARAVTAATVASERCLIVGDPAIASGIADKLSGRHAEVVGLVTLTEALADLEAVVERNRAHRVIVVPGTEGDGDAMLACVSKAQALGTQVSILPRVFEVVGSSVEFDHVDGMVLLGVHRFGLNRSSWAIKRTVDIVGATLALLVLTPVFAAIALAIKLDSRGPVFFRQPRVGHKGCHFGMVKFRSMVDGADALRDNLVSVNLAGDGLFKVHEDPRITRVGAFLRRHSLDELPQLFNVVRGEMSLVGPRPLVLEEDARIEGRHRRRLQLTPGMTGPWQVLGTAKRRVPLGEMVTLDYLYVGNWSLWTDVKILLRTAVHVLRGHGL